MGATCTQTPRTAQETGWRRRSAAAKAAQQRKHTPIPACPSGSDHNATAPHECKCITRIAPVERCKWPNVARNAARAALSARAAAANRRPFAAAKLHAHTRARPRHHETTSQHRANAVTSHDMHRRDVTHSGMRSKTHQRHMSGAAAPQRQRRSHNRRRKTTTCALESN